MDIAILLNGNIDPQFIESFVNYDQMIIEWLAPVKKNKVTVYKSFEMEKPSFNHDLYVSSGSKNGVTEDIPWINFYQEVVENLLEKKLPHFGICFGHQMIAKAMGCKVGRSHKGWGVGVHNWKTLISQKNNFFDPNKKSFQLLVSHQDQVLEVKKEMSVFLSSEFCPYAGFTIGDHVMTVQGHPEFSPKYASALLDLRRQLFPPEVYHQANLSLSHARDNLLLIEWIKTFFNL